MYYYVNLYKNNGDYPAQPGHYYCREMLCRNINNKLKLNRRNGYYVPYTKIEIRITEAPDIPEAYINFLKAEFGIESYENYTLIFPTHLFTIQKLSLILLLLIRPYIIESVCQAPEINFESFILNAVRSIPLSYTSELVSLLGFFLSKFKVKGRPVLSLDTRYPKYFLNGISTYTKEVMSDPKRLIKCQQGIKSFIELTGVSSSCGWFCIRTRNVHTYVYSFYDYLRLMPEDLQ
jgi:hypothetical protein